MWGPSFFRPERDGQPDVLFLEAVAHVRATFLHAVRGPKKVQQWGVPIKLVCTFFPAGSPTTSGARKAQIHFHIPHTAYLPSSWRRTSLRGIAYRDFSLSEYSLRLSSCAIRRDCISGCRPRCRDNYVMKTAARFPHRPHSGQIVLTTCGWLMCPVVRVDAASTLRN